MRYSVRVFAEGERLPIVDRTVAVEARDIAEARERGLACIDEVEVWDGWQDDDTDERVTRYLTDIVRQEGLAERLEGTDPLTDEETEAAVQALEAALDAADGEEGPFPVWEGALAKLRARLAREDG